MYRRLIILSLVILTALCGLVWLGYHSIQIRAQGMEGTRLGEFAADAGRTIFLNLNAQLETLKPEGWRDVIESFIDVLDTRVFPLQPK